MTEYCPMCGTEMKKVELILCRKAFTGPFVSTYYRCPKCDKIVYGAK